LFDIIKNSEKGYKRERVANLLFRAKKIVVVYDNY